jgi:NAD(P)-dependent dehydrogenase (short-subunit alcohol dehydrogenase family)
MKEEISSSYIDNQKKLHAAKPLAAKRRALIIGATDGPNIGSNIANRFESDGAEIYIPERQELNVEYLTYRSLDKYNECDILVCANGHTELDWFEDNTLSNIDLTFAVNVVGSLQAANLFVNQTIDAPHKKYIVFIGSMAYKNVLNASVAYCASKAALAHATKCLGWELAPKGFNVFCVHPSNTEGTPMAEKTIEGIMRYRNMGRSEAEAYWGAVLPKEKWLQPEDISEVVSFLVSGKADYMSGSNIELAGGQR